MKQEMTKSVYTCAGRISVHSSAGPQERATALLWPSLFTSGHATWEQQLAPLHALGYRTLLVDPPGHGRSGHPPSHFTMRQCSEAALQILDNEGVQRAAFLGVSWGGFVALQTAIIAPERVTSLVLSNTSAYRMPAMTRLQDSLVAALIRVGFPESFGLPGSLGRMVVPNLLAPHTRAADPAFANLLTRQVDALDRVGLARAVRSVLVGRENLGDGLHKISAPTLVVAGAVDRALRPAEHAQRIAANITGARYVVIPDVAHLAPREAPATFTSLLQEFLALAPPAHSVSTDRSGPQSSPDQPHQEHA